MHVMRRRPVRPPDGLARNSGCFRVSLDVVEPLPPMFAHVEDAELVILAVGLELLVAVDQLDGVVDLGAGQLA